MLERTALLKREIAVALKGQNWGRALTRTEELCDLEADNARTWFHRGYCLARLGRLPDAARCLQRSLELEPGADKVADLLGRVRARLADDSASSPHATVSADAPGSGRHEATSDGDQADQRLTRVAAPSPTGRASAPGMTAVRVWRAGTVVAGRYEVREAKRGGMGVVYLAFDRELQRTVAVKTPLPSTLASGDGRARFYREAESWIALGMHPNICTAYYVQEIGGVPRLFIEYVDGGDLDQWIRTGGLTDAQRLDIAIQIADAMDYTHSLSWTDDHGLEHTGLLHRDLKPGNVLMTVDGTARITDFGLVRALAEDTEETEPPPADEMAEALRAVAADGGASGTWQTVTRDGGVVGTPPYMAPELWRPTQRATAASDIYAYGCVLYELFCGRRPFLTVGKGTARGADLPEWLKLHVAAEPPDPSFLLPGLDETLCRLMVSCLAKDPGQRPPSFADVSRKIKEIYAGTAGHPYPRPQPEHTQLLADSLNNRAVSYITLGRVGAAEHGWRCALSVEPNHVEATFNLALWEWSTAGLTDAELLRRMEAPRSAAGATLRADHLLGKLHLVMDDPEAAVDHLRRAEETSAEARRDLGLALLARARHSADPRAVHEARQVFARALEESDTDVVAAVAMVSALRTLGRGDEAAELWEHTRSLTPELPESPDHAMTSYLPVDDRRLTVRLPGRIAALAAMRDGVAVVREQDGSVCTVDLDRGERTLTSRIPGLAARGRCFAVDGAARLFATGEEERVTIWELDSGKTWGRFKPHSGHLTALALSADDSRALSGGSDRNVRLWDTFNGDCLKTLSGHTAFVSAVAFHPSAATAVSGGGAGAIKVWELTSGTCLRTLVGHNGPVNAVAFVAGEHRLVSAGRDGTVRVWCTNSGEQLHSLAGHGAPVTEVAAVGTQSVFASAGEDQTVRLWDAAAGTPLRMIRFPEPLRGMCVSPASRRVLVACGDTVVGVEITSDAAVKAPYALTLPVATAELSERETLFRSHLAYARGLLVDGKHEEAVTALRSARAVPGYGQHAEALELWGNILVNYPKETLRTVAELRSLAAHTDQVNVGLLTSDGRSAVSASNDGSARQWDVATGAAVRVFTGHTSAVSAAAVVPDGTKLVSADREGALRTWDLATGDCLSVTVTGSVSITSIAVTPDGRSVAAAGSDGTVRIFSLDARAKPRLVASHHEAVAGVAVSADGRFGASGGWDQSLMVWSTAHGTPLFLLRGHEGAITDVDLSADCRRVASASEDGTARVWDAARGRELRVMSGHDGAVTCVAISPDVRFLLTGGKDGTLRVWDLRTGRMLRTVDAHTATVTSTAFSADARHALTAGADGTLRLWFLDWEPDLRDRGDWDERARPFLEVFLRLRQPGHGVAPTWSDHDLEHLEDDLHRRGYGGIRRHRLRRELEALVHGWTERRAAEQRHEQRDHQRQVWRQRAAPAANLVSRLTRNLGIKLAVVAAVAIVVLLVIQAVKVPVSTSIELSDTLSQEFSQAFRQRADALAAAGHVMAFHDAPATGEAPECTRAALVDDVSVFLNPQNHTTSPLEPSRMCEDETFRDAYRKAIHCLPRVGDSDTIAELLNGLSSATHPKRRTDLVSVLVQTGNDRVPVLAEALGHGNVEVRHTAALALVHRADEASMQPLTEAVHSDQPATREAALFVLRELVASDAISVDEGFDLAANAVVSINPQIRRHGIRALTLFKETEPVRELLDEALQDPDEAVRGEARIARALIREARRRELFGD